MVTANWDFFGLAAAAAAAADLFICRDSSSGLVNYWEKFPTFQFVDTLTL